MGNEFKWLLNKVGIFSRVVIFPHSVTLTCVHMEIVQCSSHTLACKLNLCTPLAEDIVVCHGDEVNILSLGVCILGVSGFVLSSAGVGFCGCKRT